MERRTRVLETGGGPWRAVEAWRGASGHALAYFLPLAKPDDSGDPVVVEDDDADRRAALEPGRTLEELSGEVLAELRESGTGLTGTERRFRAPDGRLWLAQSVGPVWAEGGVAAGLTGVLFTSLEGKPERGRGDGEHVGEAGDDELARWWRDALDREGEG